jgi:DNA-binding Lrp family transcriptional regulator
LVGNKAYSDLIREFWGSFWNVKKPYVEIARRLGVDEDTVRNRIKHLEDSGFLIGWRLVLNPILLARRYSYLLLEVKNQDFKEEIISRLKVKDGVISIISIYNNSLLVTLFDDEEKKASREISKMGIRTHPPIVQQINVPQTNLQMTPNDWKICKLLLRNAESRMADVAAGVKVSAKTVKRRLNKMMSSSAIFIMPMVSHRKAVGIPYHLMIQTEEGRKAEVELFVASRIDNLVFRAADSKNGFLFIFTGSNIAEGKELIKLVNEHSGVKFAKLSIVEEVVYTFDWLEREIEGRITTTR